MLNAKNIGLAALAIIAAGVWISVGAYVCRMWFCP